MNEKKSLNFDFLDEGLKDVGAAEKRRDAKFEAPRVTNQEKIGFIQYFRECYSDFVGFSENNLINKNPKYLPLAIWILGIGTTADRLSGSIKDHQSWGEVWAVALFGGILSGVVGYYVAGWFYNVRIKWSKGRGDVDASRNIYVFSTLPISMVSILSLVFNQMAYGDAYLGGNSSGGTTVDVLVFFVFIIALIYSIRISYRTAREVLKAEKSRAIWWFIVAPVIFYLLIALSAASA